MQHSRLTFTFKPLMALLAISHLLLLYPHHHLMLLVVFLSASSSSHASFKVLQWNAGGLRARSTKLLHTIWSHPVDLICIQKSNLKSFSSFQMLEFSTLQSDCTHSRSGNLSPDATHTSGGVINFVRQGLSFL